MLRLEQAEATSRKNWNTINAPPGLPCCPICFGWGIFFWNCYGLRTTKTLNLNSGYITIHREFRTHWIWRDSEPFTKRMAWIDMIMRANWKPKKVILNNEIVMIERGQFLCSERNIASDYLWGRTKLRNFWQLLESDAMISLNKNHGKTIITICNYNTWQISGNHEQTKSEPETNQERTKSEPRANRTNKYKEVKEGKEVTLSSARPREESFTAYKNIYEQSTGQPCRNYRPSERKKLVELENDFGATEVQETYQYFLTHIDDFVQRNNGSKGLDWFHHKFDEIREAMRNPPDEGITVEDIEAYKQKETNAH